MSVIVDVREKDEYEVEHVAHSINVPLSSFSSVAPGVLNMCTTKKVTFMCLGGARATQAAELAKGLGYDNIHDYAVYDGGLLQWKKDGNDVITAGKNPITIIRQVQLLIGMLILTSSLLGFFINPVFSIFAAFLGTGVFYAGLSGQCKLANVIAKLPWNQSKDMQCEPCSAS